MLDEDLFFYSFINACLSLLAAIAELVDNAVDEVWFKSIIFFFLSSETVLVNQHEKYCWMFVAYISALLVLCYVMIMTFKTGISTRLRLKDRLKIPVPMFIGFEFPLTSSHDWWSFHPRCSMVSSLSSQSWIAARSSQPQKWDGGIA